MKRILYTAVGGLVMLSMTAGAASFQNITAYDNMTSSFFGTPDGMYELNEVELGMVANSSWDLRRFLFDSTSHELQVQGGYNMMLGNHTIAGSIAHGGDIFIDTDGTVKYGNQTGNGVTPVGADPDTGSNIRANLDFGWEYAIVFNRDDLGNYSGGYNVYSLSSASDFEVNVAANNGANPYRLVTRTGHLLTGYGGSVSQSSSAAEYTLSGMNLDWLAGQGSGLTFHYTMECGNDSMIGKTGSFSVPDGGLTLLLLGGSLSALGFVSRRVRKNQ